MVVAFDSSVLLGYYQSKAGLPVTAGGTTSAVSAGVSRYAPTPPWQPGSAAPQESALVQSVMGGHSFINENAAQLDLPGASDDYRKLFALYQGVNALYGLADQAKAKGVSAYQIAQYSKAFARGLSEVTGYVNGLDLSQLRVTQGAVASSETSASVANQPTKYTTKVLHSGTASDAVDAFQGAVKFDINIKKGASTQTVSIDLSQMGSQTRSMGNVVGYINSQLQAAGVFTRFATVRTPAPAQTVTNGKTTTTLPPGPDQWSLAINTSPVEQVSFTTSQTATAVYVAQTAGTPASTTPLPAGATDAAKKAAAAGTEVTQLLKFQTDGTPPPQGELQSNYVDGRLFSTDLEKSIDSAAAMATGPDGSVYVLANVTDTAGGQTIKGTQDVALQKYDSAGNLVYTRNLGAAASATGLAISVSATGQVAIGGSVTGALDAGEAKPGTTPDSFVSLYDASGQEVWTVRRGATAADQVNALAFGSDGTVYVAGQTASAMPGTTGALGGATDGYIEAIGTTAKGAAQIKFTTQYGTSGTDTAGGIAVNGSTVYVAGVEQGHGVVRSFDVSGAAPVQSAIRDLGDLQGGNIVGVAVNASGNVVVGGSTFNGGLSAGTVTSSPTGGGEDAFAAVLDPTLTAGGGDTIAYYGGSGDDKATAMAVSGDQVWLTGSAGTGALGGTLGAVGKKDGFLVNLNVATGAADYSRRFTSRDGIDAPTGVAVAGGGASLLDQLGLPQGVIDQKQSVRLIDNTSVRAGDTFYIKTAEAGAMRKITIDANETLDTLKLKIQRAASFQVSATTTAAAGGKRALQLKPETAHNSLELVAGPAGHDALEALGLKAGVIRQTTVSSAGKVVSADGKGQVYGLTIDNDLNLGSTDAINHAVAQLSGALSVIVGAYRDLKIAATPQDRTASGSTAGGPVPAYLSSQIANYQAGLNRLLSGGDTSTGLLG